MNPIRYIIEFARLQKAAAHASIQTQRAVQALRRDIFFAHFCASDRFKDPKRLFRGSYKVLSEGNEDGMISEVFSRIGAEGCTFAEIGVGDGFECNTAFLLTQGWSGVWFECSIEAVNKARANFCDFPVKIIGERVTLSNVDRLLAEHYEGQSLDLLSIDIDSYDFHVWQAISTVRPRVVVIEYNASIPPHVSQTIPYKENFTPPVGTIYFGASLGALVNLAGKKGYSLVGCSLTGVNALFVRNDLLADHFLQPYTAENHYEPPRYGLIGQPGHAPGVGPWLDI